MTRHETDLCFPARMNRIVEFIDYAGRNGSPSRPLSPGINSTAIWRKHEPVNRRHAVSQGRLPNDSQDLKCRDKCPWTNATNWRRLEKELSQAQKTLRDLQESLRRALDSSSWQSAGLGFDY